MKQTVAVLATLLQVASSLPALSFLTVGPAHATSQATPATPSHEARFDALVGEIGALRADLEKLGRRERTLLGEIDRLELEDALRSREITRLAVQKARAAQELEETHARLVTLTDQIHTAEIALAGHLRQIYETGQLRQVRMVLSVTEPVDVMRAMAYFDVMARRESEAMGVLRQRRAEAESLQSALAAQRQTLEELERENQQRSGELREIRQRSSDLLASVRTERDAHQSAVDELTRAAEDLEKAIVSGSAGVGAGGPGSISLDVTRMRGALPWPVSGVVKVPFGDVKHPRFQTTTPHPGIDIETAPHAPIRAILGGRVVFGRRFSGYGNTVLVDHGGRYLSAYARASVLNVVEGEEVLPGQILGVAAEQSADGGPPTVYFEFRHEGRAVDPAQWLKGRTVTMREGYR